MLSLAIICRSLFPKAKELSRKIVHIGIGPIVPFAWWLGISRELAIPIASIITISLLINKYFQLLPAVEDIKRESYGTVAYGLSITILLILFWPVNAAAVSAGVLVMAFGDGFAGLVGPYIHSPSWEIWNQRKSIAGTITMTLITALVLLTLSSISGTPFHPLKIIVITALAVSLEQISLLGIDNLTVPIGVAYAWQWMTNL